LAVGAGLQVMQQLMEADVTAACGRRGKHDPARAATRHGTAPSAARSPWAAGGCRSLGRGSSRSMAPASFRCRRMSCSPPPRCWERMAMERMLAGVSTRRYPVALESVGSEVSSARRRPASRRCRGSSWP
jgi:hypothetical protein